MNQDDYKILRPWTEVVGKHQGFYTNDQFTYIKIDERVFRFPKEQAERITEKLEGLKGRKIALLRTDDPTKPIMVRTLNET